MHIQTHIMSGWCVGNMVPLNARERLFCMLAASLQDLDGLGIVFGQKAYWDYHHILGHNLLFCGVLAAVLAIFSTKRVLAFCVYFVLGHVHLVLDYYGSGPGWPICYRWPFERSTGACWMNPNAWPFHSWQNIFAAVALLVWTVAIAVVKKRTPLEVIMPKLDRKLVGIDQ